jgi:hypothetical protein
MISRLRKLAIRDLARVTLLAHDAMYLPVRPKIFAEQNLDILVESFDPPHPSISGYLMQVGDLFGIGYSKAIRCEGFQNFTVAHEIGHYLIDGHAMALLKDGVHHSHSSYISKDPFEEEADAFASEFLMPWKLVESLLRGSDGGFASIQHLSDQCGSSLVASAIRYVEVTAEQVAAVVSYQGTVEFMTASPAFRQIPGIDWFHRRDSLPRQVPSACFANDHSWVNAGLISENGSLLRDWFPSAPPVEVREDIVGLGTYGRLLTVLMTDCECEGDEGDDALEDDYIERWKEGRFRKK